MSAYIVGHSLIDAVLTTAVNDRNSPPRYRKDPGVYVPINSVSATEVGRILLRENERSVMHRYPGEPLEDMPGTIGETSAKYAFKERRTSPVAVLKALNCLGYQSCETDDWGASEAFRIIAALRDHAICKLPGYQDGPGWDDFDRKEVA